MTEPASGDPLVEMGRLSGDSTGIKIWDKSISIIFDEAGIRTEMKVDPDMTRPPE